jgi:hypothetical protein
LPSGIIQGTLSTVLNIHGTLREHSGDIQGTMSVFIEHSHLRSGGDQEGGAGGGDEGGGFPGSRIKVASPAQKIYFVQWR